MKTTIRIPQPIFRRARKLADRERVKLRALVERGLRLIVGEDGSQLQFKLRSASFAGEGLQPDVRGVSWDRVRDLAYEGRGAKTIPS